MGEGAQKYRQAPNLAKIQEWIENITKWTTYQIVDAPTASKAREIIAKLSDIVVKLDADKNYMGAAAIIFGLASPSVQKERLPLRWDETDVKVVALMKLVQRYAKDTANYTAIGKHMDPAKNDG